MHGTTQRSIALVVATIVYAVTPAEAEAQSPDVSTNKSSYTAGEPIVATFSNGPGHATDWLGIYPQGVTPDGSPASTDWFYVNGSKTAGAALTSGQVTFNTSLSDGNWVMWFLANDGYTALDSTPFVVASGGTSAIRIGPYLQNATSNSIVIMWETSSGDESRVDFWPTAALGTAVWGTAITGSGSSRIHTVQLTGLQQDTYYYYRVTTGSASSATMHFRTMPTSTEADSRFVVYSDMQEQGAAPTNLHGQPASSPLQSLADVA